MSTANQLLPRWVRANDLDFAYLELGQGPLVLCLHGFPDTAWSFVPVLNRLAAAGYRAVAPFMRGYAPTSLPADGDYSMRALGRDVLALIPALGEEQADLVGHDWGASAVYFAAAQEPQRIRKIVTAAVPHVRHFVLRPRWVQLARSRYMAFFQLRGVPERRIRADDFAWLRALIREWSPGWNFTAADFAPLRAGFSDPLRLAAALGYYRAMPRGLVDRESWRLLLKPLQVPARVIRGARDGCIGAEMFEGQEDCFGAGYELVTMQGAGHFMHCENPHEFSRHVIEFFNH